VIAHIVQGDMQIENIEYDDELYEDLDDMEEEDDEEQ
jgi:DNA recombination-dependent growth factor C